MSFELVNHQLKHMFGGIQAQKNPSLEFLQNYQKKITKSMQKAQQNHKKIYQSIQIIKSNLQDLSQNYLNLSKENKYSGELIKLLSFQINHFFQDIAEESLSLSKKMQNKVQSYIPNLKKINEKFKQSAQTLEHYRKKVTLLKKNVEKQTLANIKQDQHQRFQRNKDKLKKAEKEYDELLIKTTKRYYEFNHEGLKDIYNDLVTIFSNIGGNVLQMTSKVTKHLAENFSLREITIAKQLKLSKKITDNLQNIHKESQKDNNRPLGKQQLSQHCRQFFNHLCQQKQMSNYLKSIIDKQILKVQTLKIQDAFSIMQKQQKQNNKNIIFDQFKNVYNNKQLKDSAILQENIIEGETVKQNSFCDDLLDIEEPTDVIKEDQDQISRYQVECSPQIERKFSEHSIEIVSQHHHQKIKNNLQIFNKICQESSKNKSKMTMKPINKGDLLAQKSKPQKHKLASIKSQQEFLNLPFFSQNDKKKQDLKEKKIQRPQEELSKRPENAFNFDIFEKLTFPTDQNKKPDQNSDKNIKIDTKGNKNIDKRGYTSNISIQQSSNLNKEPLLKKTIHENFLNFDFFLPENHEPQKKSQINNTSSLNNPNNFNFFQSTPTKPVVNQLPPKPKKQVNQPNQPNQKNEHNLLNL